MEWISCSLLLLRILEREHFLSSPEALIHSDHWRDLLIDEPLCKQVVALAIDEVHCVYEWGENSGYLMDKFMNSGHYCQQTFLC